ncbi:MAG: thioredoxin family protein [Saccharolobus sp.]|uniref:Protein disulfide oxidoreductase (Thioredoxin reductase-dependent) n=3 Tax=Saccharolobus TaxID=2100760 RepID=A0A8F5BY23_9CREN|nr:thioredoxin family protein [Saccharolobus shibatae]MCH4814383.1 thioredoxin family protein [Saccharolobus shibatae]QXJ27207.1 Protein disulfide oxidoreductase (thioredoxin reductase-dependent) [Saccharolobus shibatae B12]QXJ30484.1 Protein disulfide oxidoreductase (thioredoxin reductase-dependent) [Saccharolobus shibatae]QXJ33531.1 Protein disulfide oxidoreductase (thioredoxin reductase-dependent) [Saccharolobus shibatae]
MEQEYAELFSDEVKNALQDALKDMRNPVDVYVFVDSEDSNCQYCSVTTKFLEFIASAAPKDGNGSLLKVHIVDRANQNDRKIFEEFNVERVPTVAFYNGYIRWTGAPLGEEIRALVETIVRLSQGESGLSQETVEAIKSKLNGKVKIETVVTPSCPYCPYAALMAHMVAFEACRAGKCNVVSDVVEAYENQDIAEKYQVMSVPSIAINESVEFIGVPYEENFINAILEKQKIS